MNKATRAPPICSDPVGLGAKRVRTVMRLDPERLAMPRPRDVRRKVTAFI